MEKDTGDQFYIIKRTSTKDNSVKYFLNGHSILNEGATHVSKYYCWKAERGAKSRVARLKKEYDDPKYIWEVVNVVKDLNMVVD